jgi:predicted MFS family arabinose efflux permease
MSVTAAAPSPASSSTLRSAAIAAILFCMYAAFGAAWLGTRPLFPEIQAALDVDLRGAAWLLSIVSMAKSFTPILAGIVAARIGLTSTMRGAALLMCVALVVPWLPSFEAWVVARFLFGVGGAVWVALMGAVVVDVIAAEHRALVNAMNGVAVNTGAVVGLKFAIPLQQALGGFRGALSVFALALAVCTVALFAIGSVSSTTRPVPQPLRTTLSAYAAVLRESSTWIVALAFTGPLALYLVLSTYLPSHMEQAYAMSRVQALGWLIHTMVWAIPSSLAVGFLLQRRLGSPRLHMMIAAAIAPVASYFALQATTDEARQVWFALVGLGLFWPVAPLVTALQTLPQMTPARVGMVMGTMASVSYVVSAFAPDVVGAVVAAGGTVGSALIPGCLFGVTPALGLLLPSGPRR